MTVWTTEQKRKLSIINGVIFPLEVFWKHRKSIEYGTRMNMVWNFRLYVTKNYNDEEGLIESFCFPFMMYLK